MSENKHELRDDLIKAGKIGATRGLGGHLKVFSYSGEFGHIENLEEVYLEKSDTDHSMKRMRIVGRNTGKWGLSLVFEGYDTPEKARELIGMNLLVPKSGACPLSENEWYVADLIGMKLVFEGRSLAEVVAVIDGAADPLLESELVDGGRHVLVPFRNEFIGKVDTRLKTMELIHEWILE
jgi:16S rRNA processing protein RimM